MTNAVAVGCDEVPVRNRREPRWLTVSDLLALVVGCAIAFVLFPLVVLPYFPGMSIPVWFVILLILLWGPLTVLGNQFAFLFPLSIFKGNEWVFWSCLEILRGLGLSPYEFLFAVPAMATLLEMRRRGARAWVWTEWIGVGTASLLGIAWLIWFYLVTYEIPPLGWICQRIVTAIGLAFVCLASWRLVTRNAATWSRWLGDCRSLAGP